MLNPKSPDSRDLKRRVLLGILSSPLTVLPFLTGMTVMAGVWMINVRPDLGLLAGLAGALGTAGMFVTQLVFRGEQYAQQVLKETQEEARIAQERHLDDLERRLTADKDPRTETALKDLRSLVKAFDDPEDLGVSKEAVVLFEIQINAMHMFEQAVRSLEQSLVLWHTANGLATPAAREPILAKREHILREIFQSIHHLGKVLAGLQDIRAAGGSTPDLARIRDELDQNLDVARQVDVRLKDFERELRESVLE